MTCVTKYDSTTQQDMIAKSDIKTYNKNNYNGSLIYDIMSNEIKQVGNVSKTTVNKFKSIQNNVHHSTRTVEILKKKLQDKLAAKKR